MSDRGADPSPSGPARPNGRSSSLREAEVAAVAAVLVELRRELRRGVRGATASDDPAPLPVAQVEVLQAVHELTEQGSAPRIRDVAAALSLADNTVSGLVAELVRREHLSRNVDPSDERAVRLGMTPSGKDQLQAWARAHARVLAAGLASRGAGARLSAANDVLEDLVEILRATRSTSFDGEPRGRAAETERPTSPLRA